jgi:hypothetical protein
MLNILIGRIEIIFNLKDNDVGYKFRINLQLISFRRSGVVDR